MPGVSQAPGAAQITAEALSKVAQCTQHVQHPLNGRLSTYILWYVHIRLPLTAGINFAAFHVKSSRGYKWPTSRGRVSVDAIHGCQQAGHNAARHLGSGLWSHAPSATPLTVSSTPGWGKRIQLINEDDRGGQ